MSSDVASFLEDCDEAEPSDAETLGSSDSYETVGSECEDSCDTDIRSVGDTQGEISADSQDERQNSSQGDQGNARPLIFFLLFQLNLSTFYCKYVIKYRKLLHNNQEGVKTLKAVLAEIVCQYSSSTKTQVLTFLVFALCVYACMHACVKNRVQM